MRKLDSVSHQTNTRPRVVIVGGGFGGVAAARQLRRADADVVLVDKRNYHLFQPLLYQVATAALNPSDIASPIRKIFRHQKNVNVVMGEATGVNVADQTLEVEGQSIPFDYLVLAAGAGHSYFGNDQWSAHAPGLKTIDDATEIRRRFLKAFEAAEIETDPEAREACLTFVIAGGGPTGCEMAGAMAEIARNHMPDDFRRVDTATARIILVEAGPRILSGMPEASSISARKQLESLGVEIRLNQPVTHVSEDGVALGDEFLPARNVVWAAGVKASPIGESLGVELDRAGRVKVNPDLSVGVQGKVFVIGDQAAAKDAKTGKPVPGVAQGAMQGGAYVGKLIRDELRAAQRGRSVPERKPFTYFDKGSMAVIGRNKAVADAFGLKFGGYPAWLLWAFIHIIFLVNFRSKLAVGFNWAWTYIFGDRGARLITGDSKLRTEQPSRSVASLSDDERRRRGLRPAEALGSGR